MGNILQMPEVVAALVVLVVGGLISIIKKIFQNVQRNREKLVIFTNRTKVEFYKRDSYGGQEEIKEPIKWEAMTICIDLDLYNSSDIPRTIGEVKVELVEKKSKKIFDTGELIVGSSMSSPFPYRKIPITTRTIYPKLIETLRCNVNLEPKDISPFKSVNRVFLIANFPEKRKFRVQVYGEINFGEFGQ